MKFLKQILPVFLLANLLLAQGSTQAMEGPDLRTLLQALKLAPSALAAVSIARVVLHGTVSTQTERALQLTHNMLMGICIGKIAYSTYFIYKHRLCVAVFGNYIGWARKLLAAGFNVNDRISPDRTALDYAVINCRKNQGPGKQIDYRMVKLLLAAGAEVPAHLEHDPIIIYAQGSLAIEASLAANRITIGGNIYELSPTLQALLTEAKSTPNAKDAHSRTVLHRLVIFQKRYKLDPELVDYLTQQFVDLGIDVTLKDKFGHTAQDYKTGIYKPASYKIGSSTVTGSTRPITESTVSAPKTVPAVSVVSKSVVGV